MLMKQEKILELQENKKIMWITSEILFPKSELRRLKEYFIMENGKATPTERYVKCLEDFLLPLSANYLEWGDNIILWEDINIFEYVYGILDDELISKILGDVEIERASMCEEDGTWNYWVMRDGKDLSLDNYPFALKAYHLEQESSMRERHRFCIDALSCN